MSLAALVLSLAIAQAAPSTPPPASAPAPGAPGETYTYEPGGRRDPFLNLLDTGTGTGPMISPSLLFSTAR